MVPVLSRSPDLVSENNLVELRLPQLGLPNWKPEPRRDKQLFLVADHQSPLE